MNGRDWYRYHRRKAWIAQGRRCGYCFQPLAEHEVTGDHLRPKAHGGTTVRHRKGRPPKSNIRAACERCNQAKGSLKKTAFIKILNGKRPPENIDQQISGILYRVHRVALRARANVRKCARAA